jgi:hypothetical protein
MTATKIAAAYERWYKIQTATYPGDIPAADSDEWYALKTRIAGMRAVCLPDTLAKVRLLIETEKAYGREDEMLASIAADLERLEEGTDETLVKLFDERMALSADAAVADNQRDFDTAHVLRLSERYNEIDDTIADTPAMSFRGLRVKARLAQITCDEPTGWDATIALSLGADIERFVGKGGAA